MTSFLPFAKKLDFVLGEEAFEKHSGRSIKCQFPTFFSFYHNVLNFSTLSRSNSAILSIFYLLSANAISLDHFKNL